MKRMVWLLVLPWLSVAAQKGKAYVLTYKFSAGEEIRVSTSTYRTFTAGLKGHKKSSYGETAFDLYQTISNADGGVYDVDARVEVTRVTRDGQNFTYKLSKLFAGHRIYFTVDRFGTVDVTRTSLEKSADSASQAVKQEFPTFEHTWLPLPQRPVRVGEKWDAAEVVSLSSWLKAFDGVYRMEDPQVRGTYKLEDVNEGVARIVLDVEVSISGTVADTGTDVVMAITGEYFFDVNRGRLQNGTSVVRLESIAVTSAGEVEYSGSITSTFSMEDGK